MIARIGRNSLAILTVVALIALVGIAAGCEGDDATTTTGAGSPATTVADATATTAVDSTESTTASTAPLGKSLDDYKAEIPGLQQAVEADPTDLFSLESLAVAHYQLDEYEQAEAAYLKILAIQEDAFTRNNLGNVYRDWGKTEEAKAAYRKAIEDDPTLKYPYVNLAGVLQKEGDVEGARELLEEGAKHVAEDGQSMLDAAEEKLTSTTTT